MIAVVVSSAHEFDLWRRGKEGDFKRILKDNDLRGCKFDSIIVLQHIAPSVSWSTKTKFYDLIDDAVYFAESRGIQITYE